MNPDPSVLDLSTPFGTPSRRTVGRRVCSTPIATGDSWSSPGDQTNEDNSSLLDTLDSFIEQYGTFFKSSSSPSVEQSVGLSAADDGADGVSDMLDFVRAADKDSDEGSAPLDGTLPFISSSHLEAPELSKITRASPWIVNEDGGNDHPPSIRPLDATQIFCHPPDSPSTEDSNEDALLDICEPLIISSGLQATQAHESSPLFRLANKDDDENFLLCDSPDSPKTATNNKDPLLDCPLSLTTPGGLMVNQAHASSPLLRFFNCTSDEDRLLCASPPLVIPSFVGVPQNCKNSPECSSNVNVGGSAPLLGSTEFYENHSGLPLVDSKGHKDASLQNVPHFPRASSLGVLQTCEDSEFCQDAPRKTQPCDDFTAHASNSTGTAESVPDPPALDDKNDIVADIPTTQHLSYRHSPVFFTGILDSVKKDCTAVGAVCASKDSNSSRFILGEDSEPVAQTEEVVLGPPEDPEAVCSDVDSDSSTVVLDEHSELEDIEDVDLSSAEENDDMLLAVTDELDESGGKTPAVSCEAKEQDSPACSVKSTDTLLLDIDKEDRTIIVEDLPEQDTTLVNSSPAAEDPDPHERPIAGVCHRTVDPLDSEEGVDLRQKINNIRNSAATVAGCSSTVSEGECGSVSDIAGAQFSKHRAPSSFVISHLHDSQPGTSKAASAFQRLDLEQPGQKPQTSAPAASRHAPFMSEDPEENNDNENPEWERLRQLSTDEERYEAVRNVWHNSTIPNPHSELTTFHYRQQILGAQGTRNTPVPKQHKRKASRNCSHRPAKRQRMDTDVFDLKLKALQRKRSQDFQKARQDLELNLGQLQSSIHQNQRRGDFQQGHGSHHRNHRRANTTPWDFRYYQQEEQRLHAQFVAHQDTIHQKYSAKENKLLSAREEVRRFDKFYVGLQQADPTLLTEEQLKEQLNMEKLLGQFRLWYKNAKD